jgi:hypothetical protein
MHHNTFLTIPEIKKKYFMDLILVVRKCIKTCFYGLYSGGQEMHQNTLLTTPDVKK